jgi:hypothetical protein
MIAQQQADNATVGSMQQGSDALKQFTNQNIADLEKMNGQGLIKSASDWDAWKQSIAGNLQQLAGVSYDVAQKMAANIITAAKNNQNVTGQTALMTQMYQKWLDTLKSGVLISWGDFQAQQFAKADAAIAKTAPKVKEIVAHLAGLNTPETVSINTDGVDAAKKHTAELQAHLNDLNKPEKPPVDTGNIIQAGVIADQTRRKLIAINGPYDPIVNNAGTINAGNTADQTRRKLLNINGPYDPIVNVSSVVNAGAAADNARNKLRALNGTSSWTAYANLNQINTVTNVVSTIAAGPGNARASGGMIDEPVVGFGLRTGKRWTFGENGPEMVTPMRGGSGASSGGGSSGGGQQSIKVEVYLDGYQMAQRLMPHHVNIIRNATGTMI